MTVTKWFFALYIPTIVLISLVTNIGFDKPFLYVTLVVTTIVWTRWAAHLVPKKEDENERL